MLRSVVKTLLNSGRNISRTTTIYSDTTASASVIPEAVAYADADADAPVELKSNPYEKPARKCLLCRTGVDLDYKNARLLQQFVSNFSGRVYDQHVTGLCDMQHRKLLETISISRNAGYMPILVKDPKYLKDPKLFDPLKPLRPHSFA